VSDHVSRQAERQQQQQYRNANLKKIMK